MARNHYRFNLKAALELINNNCLPQFEIQEVWADFGAGTKHTTLVSKPRFDVNGKPRESYQLLSIKEAERARLGLLRLEDVGAIIDRVNERNW